MDAELVARGVAAASSLARELDLPVDDVAVVHNSHMLALRLLPGDVFARTAVVGQEVAAFEVALAQRLAALAAAPIAALDPRVPPRVYVRDGFAVTFWTYYESETGPVPPARYADALYRLHAAMQRVDVEAPHFTERVAEAEELVADQQQSPELVAADRALLLEVLRRGRQAVGSLVGTDQLLHGEPHRGNLLDTPNGPIFIDLETCCRGPVEFDVAHAPEDVGALYPGVDPKLLQECRGLILAMIAAWRWDVRDELPDGRRHGRRMLTLLRNGPPWPAFDAPSTG